MGTNHVGNKTSCCEFFHTIITSDDVSSALSLYSSGFISDFVYIWTTFKDKKQNVIDPKANAPTHVGNVNRPHGADIPSTYLEHFCAPKTVPNIGPQTPNCFFGFLPWWPTVTSVSCDCMFDTSHLGCVVTDAKRNGCSGACARP